MMYEFVVCLIIKFDFATLGSILYLIARIVDHNDSLLLSELDV